MHALIVKLSKTGEAQGAVRARAAILPLAGALLFAASCDVETPVPPSLNSGQTDFSRVVAVGNSLTAGFQSGGLVEDFQALSYPALIARAAGHSIGNDDFSFPNISYPGISALLQLVSASGPVIEPLSGLGEPTNLSFAGIYSNLAVPGATTGHLLLDPTLLAANPFFGIVARGTTPIASLAVQAQPTFIILWIGNNDVLGAVTGGDPAAMTPLTEFQASYTALLDTLATAGADMVIANLPEVTTIPFTTTIPPVVVNPETREPVLDEQGNMIPLIGQIDDPPGAGQLDLRSLVTLFASDSLSAGVGIPTALGGTGRPLPDSMVLTPSELGQITDRVHEINEFIEGLAGQRGVPVVDIHDLLHELADDGIEIAGVELSTEFVTGGLFSLDGIHPSTPGYGVIANAFIETINRHYGSNLEKVNMGELLATSTLPQQTSGLVGAAASATFRLSGAAARQLLEIFPGSR